jgi:hypothetical protein
MLATFQQPIAQEWAERYRDTAAYTLTPSTDLPENFWRWNPSIAETFPEDCLGEDGHAGIGRCLGIVEQLNSGLIK